MVMVIIVRCLQEMFAVFVLKVGMSLAVKNLGPLLKPLVEQLLQGWLSGQIMIGGMIRMEQMNLAFPLCLVVISRISAAVPEHILYG